MPENRDIDVLLGVSGESLKSIDADPEAAFDRLITEQRRLIEHLPESAPIEDFEAALGVIGMPCPTNFGPRVVGSVLLGNQMVLTQQDLDARIRAILDYALPR